MNDIKNNPAIQTSIAPWLTVRDGETAVSFYKTALGAVEVYRLDIPATCVVRLSVNGAEFWLSDGASGSEGTESVGGDTVRMILTVPNPDALFEQALKNGATEIFPVGEEHGWRLGRFADPFGLHWEIGHPIDT